MATVEERIEKLKKRQAELKAQEKSYLHNNHKKNVKKELKDLSKLERL